ncbi:MAG TPA: sigma-70 family RNA polymerase sigma factor [Candidatus Saccharimonadales bacterium]|nr:sigma-70 family RNA polymerase sigma factor [Candidatus Saccharimonadales bacterium]
MVPLEDIAELEDMPEEGADPYRIPEVLPHAVPLEDSPGIENLTDGSGSNPEEVIFASDHVGVATALSILSSRERQVLAMKAGLDESGVPRKNTEIAADFGLSVGSVSSTLTRARNRLRAVPNILGIINGEEPYSSNAPASTISE